MRRILAVAVTAVIGLAAFGTTQASASTGWQGCSAPVRTIDGYESHLEFSGLQAKRMNCASARFAYNTMYGKRLSGYPNVPSRFNDGFVTWHRTSLLKLGGTPGNSGCGWESHRVTYTEYSSGTSFSFRMYASGC